jgi:hypothetical protein
VRTFARGFCLCLAMVAVASASSAATITIGAFTGSGIESYANDSVGSNSRQSTGGITSLPRSGTLTATDGGGSSVTSYSLTNDGFHWTMNQTVVSTLNATSQTNATIYFMVDQDVDYAISGSYGLISGGAPLISLGFSIRDDVAGPFVYSGGHSSRQVAGETFTLGASGGNIFDDEEGSLTGTLLAGHQYILVLQSHLLSNLTSQAAGSATGSVTLTFVPEPATASLVALGLVAFAARRRA